MEFDSMDELNLRFIDEETIKLLPSLTLNHYYRIPKSEVNFGDIFDADQS